ncbi:arsenate reductase family protein [Myroides phaeus]|uniref:Arsenate reductase, glutaredoxin family n=1 Tax=Myroides phaeus TaxID=702745 RepID=A0A1G8B3B9_9FLAO|nr:ArsC/Spx/MgsR family protein [Myroides phaeus]MEC4115795.1 ArsC/Spx/MgsR family protein [Myroides phaeus]SDH27120.1 Arsenate reductase, glutaredoxin family [Myroides phaeus]
MKKIYYLSTCSTCKRILSEMPAIDTFELQEIKKDPITAEQLEEMYVKVGSYELLFNKRSQLYKNRELKSKNLQEEDYKDLLLEHYTFLSRPVIFIGDEIFVGNSAKVIEKAKKKAAL